MDEPAPSPRARRRFFAAVPSKVKWLIYLSAPSNVAGGFFFVVVSAYLPEIGLGSEIVGLVLGISGVSMVLSAIPLGILSDRKGRKTMLILGSAAFPPILLLFAFTTNVTFLILAGLVAGVAEAAFLSTWNALIADGTPLEGRNAAFSLSFIIGTTTGGLGFAFPIFFPALQGWTGLSSFAIHRSFLFLFGLLAAVTPIALWFLLRGHVEVLRPRQARTRSRKLGLLLRFSVVNGIIGFGAGFIIPLIPTWLFLKFAVPDTYSGPLLAASSVTMGLAGFASSGLAMRYGSVRAVVMTQSLSTVFMVSLAFVPSPAIAGGLYIIRAALMNMGSPIMDSYLMSIIDPEQRGFASAVNSIIWRLPNSLSTVFGGLLLAMRLYDLPFLIAASLYASGITSFYVLFRNVKPSG